MTTTRRAALIRASHAWLAARHRAARRAATRPQEDTMNASLIHQPPGKTTLIIRAETSSEYRELNRWADTLLAETRRKGKHEPTCYLVTVDDSPQLATTTNR